jgi:hypothetical protein
VEQIIEIIRIEPVKVLGAFIVIMALLSVSRNVVSQVISHFKYEEKYDSQWSKQMDKWGGEL